jgi:hypothetical protein
LSCIWPDHCYISRYVRRKIKHCQTIDCLKELMTWDWGFSTESNDFRGMDEGLRCGACKNLRVVNLSECIGGYILQKHEIL